MSRKKPQKQAFQDGTGYQEDALGDSKLVPTVPFDGDRPGNSVDVGEPTSVAQTRDEADKRLVERGLSGTERKVVLLRVFEHRSVREIAVEVGKSKSWVSDALKRVRCRLELKPLPDRASRTIEVPPPTSLTEAMRRAHEALACYQSGRPGDLGNLVATLSDSAIADGSDAGAVVAAVVTCPWVLLSPGGRPFLERFVKLIAVARYGGKKAAATARKYLKSLATSRRGNRSPIPDEVLASESLPICVSLRDLQQAWRATFGEPLSKRLTIRKLVGDEQKTFTDAELQSILNGDVLEGSARLAERATGIAAEAFLRVWRRMPEMARLHQ